ncbi:MAG: DMT family protein [Bryobacteraceae bacterium]|nr:DMT family protein [Bryobacteraceae bacterium]
MTVLTVIFFPQNGSDNLYMLTVLLLIASNTFMTFAWYGHLKFREAPLWQAVLASWGIAFFEYCLMVPANRWGHATMTASQLKILQEVITITVFLIFAYGYLGELPTWRTGIAFALIVAAAAVAFGGKA